jgi:hypothetical protein
MSKECCGEILKWSACPLEGVSGRPYNGFAQALGGWVGDSTVKNGSLSRRAKWKKMNLVLREVARGLQAFDTRAFAGIDASSHLWG